MNNEEIVVKFITTTVISLQNQIDKLRIQYNGNDMLESEFIDTYLSTWYKNALDEAPSMAPNLNYSVPDTIDLLAGIVNLTYEIYFGQDYEEFLPLHLNSLSVVSSLRKAQKLLSGEQNNYPKSFDLFNVRDWEKPEVQKNEIFKLQKEIISSTLKNTTQIKKGFETVSRTNIKAKPLYNSSYKIWTSDDRIKKITEKLNISKADAIKYVEEAFLFIEKKGNDIVENMSNPSHSDDIENRLISQLEKELKSRKDIAYVYFDFIREIEKYKESLINECKYESIWNLICDMIGALIHSENIEITKNENINEFYRLHFVEEIQGYKFKNRYCAYIEVLNNLETQITTPSRLEEISVIKTCLNTTYERQLKAKNKSCYIATMAYQDINHPQVEYLRTIRDTKLSDYTLGRSFIKYYYKYSPSIVKRLKNHSIINKMIRRSLDILIIVLKKYI